jgi:glycosyltransferase involved in cell wall biosynthesis
MYKHIVERDEARAHGVTVCIPYFNESQETIERAVQSALDQTVKPREIIIVDDGSEQPHIPVLMTEYSPLIRTTKITNRGLPAARNTALMLAKGEFFLPLDSDDWIDSRYIELTLPVIKAGADVVLVGLQEHGDAPRNRDYMPGYDMPLANVTEKLLWTMNRYFYCALMRTELLREIGGYHPAMAGWPGISGGYEDWDMWIDLTRRKARFACVNETLLNYTTKADSMLLRAERNKGILVDEMRRHHRCR